jgi:Zn-dependent alcohol dehydrogenase
MVKEKNSAANSVKAGEVKLFDTTPVRRLTPELIPIAHKVFVAARKGMQAALARELDADVIAPTEVDVLTEIMKSADGLMVDAAVETAGASATVIMALQSTRKLGRVVEGDIFEEPATLNVRPRD